MREQRVERGAVVLEATGFVPHAKTHRAGLCFDAYFFEQLDEIRIGTVVKDDKAGVDAMVLTIDLDVVRVSVAANMRGCLEYRDVVITVQAARGDVAGDTAADNGDSHSAPPATRRAPSNRFGTMRRSRMIPSASSNHRPQ